MWELIFMMLVLKIPILYLCWIVYWAIKSEPRPEEGAHVRQPAGPDDGPGWSPRRRPRRLRPRPHGGPVRGYRAPARAAAAVRAERRR